MKIKKELLKPFVVDLVCRSLEDFTEFDENKIANTYAIKALAEIQAVLKKIYPILIPWKRLYAYLKGINLTQALVTIFIDKKGLRIPFGSRRL